MESKRIIIAATLLTAIVLTLRPAAGVAAQSGGWIAPVQVSGTTDSSWFPDIAIGPDKSVHIVWASGIAHGPEQQNQVDLLLYSALVDGRWSKPNDIVNPGVGGFASRNTIVMGRDGLLHLLVRSQLRITYLHAPWDHASAVRDWSAPERINNQDTVYYDALATDSTGKLHAFWNETARDDPKKPNAACPSCSDVFYRRTVDAGKTWSAPINLSQSPDGSTKPQVKIDKGDGIHLVWDEGYDNLNGEGKPVAGMYRRSPDGGVTWDQPVRFTLPQFTPAKIGEKVPEPMLDAPQQMTLGLFQNQQPIIVYRSTASNTIYYQFSGDGGVAWSKPTVMPGVRARDLNDTPWDSYMMATDGAGKVHLILSGFLQNDNSARLDVRPTDQRNRPRLLHLVWDGARWSAPEVIAPEDRYPGWSSAVMAACDRIDPQSALARTDAARAMLNKCRDIERYPEWPRAVISGGNMLHLTWFTRSGNDLHNSDASHYQVWYSVKPLDAPAVAPLPLITPAPTTAPEAPTATPEPAPTPTLAPSTVNASPIDASVAWEAPGLVIATITMLVTAAFLGGVLGIMLWMRRRRSRNMNRL
jgi:BNR repeat-like domain